MIAQLSQKASAVAGHITHVRPSVWRGIRYSFAGESDCGLPRAMLLWHTPPICLIVARVVDWTVSCSQRLGSVVLVGSILRRRARSPSSLYSK